MSNDKYSATPIEDAAEDKMNLTSDNPTSENFETDEKKEKSEKSCKRKKSKTQIPDEGDDSLADAMTKEAYNLACELKDEKDKYLRLAAEYDNYRKRSQKERESIYTDIRSDTVFRFLPVYDNLERAIKQETEDDAYRKGIEMIMTQLKDVLEKLGVSEISSFPGTAFDPQLHEAVMHVVDESKDEGVIIEEFQKGFKLGDKVIRFSIVKVAN